MPIVRKSGDLDIEYILQQSQNKFFEDYIPRNLPSRMHEVVKISKDRLSIKLIDKNQRDLLSTIHGNFKVHNKIQYYEIAGTYSKLERNGFLTYLFEILIYEFGYKILSDKQHTSPGSKEFWKTHIKRNKFNIYRLNLDTNFKRNASRFSEDKIWIEVAENIYSSYLNLNDSDHLMKNDVELLDFENLDDLSLDESENLTVDNLLDEEFDIEIEKEDFENIRLVAQKYIG